MAQTAGTFMSNRAVWMVSLSCRLDALADSVSGIMREKKKHHVSMLYIVKDAMYITSLINHYVSQNLTL